MKNRKSSIFEKLFYNNKALMVFSVLLAIVLWAVVKVNYSEISSRTITGVKVTLDTALAQENEFVPFYDENDLLVDVEVSGRAYNINAYSLTRDDITIDAASGYVDAAGYRTLNLSAKVNDSDVDIVRVTPSSLTLFFDRSRTETYNVEARLTNDTSALAAEGYLIGQAVPSVSTVQVTGPASVLDKITKVYFDATIDSTLLPLSTTTDVNATVSFDLEHERDSHFLVCENISDDSNPATVTVPVYKQTTVPTTVKFINQPEYYDEHPPKVTISPAQVSLTYNAEEDTYTSFNVGTIDFRTLGNGTNRKTLTVDEKSAAMLTETVTQFNVTVDFSTLSKRTLDVTASNVVFLNQSSDYRYAASLQNTGLDTLTIIGPAATVRKLSADDVQIEINVSALNTDSDAAQNVKISNISIQGDAGKTCWVYGSYRAKVRVSEKG